MKKLLIVGLALLSGCASLSDYQRGCRDGIDQVAKDLQEQGLKGSLNEKARNSSCEELEKLHKTPAIKERR